MKITVKPNARNNDVQQINASHYLVSVTAPPVDNKANEAVIELLAEYFGKPKRAITIVGGKKRKEKIIELV